MSIGVDFMECVAATAGSIRVVGLPPGPHIVSAASSSNSILPDSMWLFASESEPTLMILWNRKTESLVPIPDSSVRDSSSVLVAYPRELCEMWSRLVSNVSLTVFNRLFVNDLENRLIVPVRVQDTTFSPQQLTKLNMDKCSLLISEVKRLRIPSMDLLGELEFTFVAFMMGRSNTAWEQWKVLVDAITRSEEIIEWNAGLFRAFIVTLSAQLEFLPKDFFHDVLASGNFLHCCLEDMVEINVDTRFAPQVLELKNLCEKRFGLVFGLEGDFEDVPVICDSFGHQLAP